MGLGKLLEARIQTAFLLEHGAEQDQGNAAHQGGQRVAVLVRDANSSLGGLDGGAEHQKGGDHNDGNGS